MPLEQQLGLEFQAALNRSRMSFGIAYRIRPERRRVMHDIARIQSTSIGVPDPDGTGAMPGEVDDFQLQTADVENVTVLDGMIDFNRAVPVFVHDRRVGKAEAFARAQIKILQHQLRRGSEASYVLPAGH